MARRSGMDDVRGEFVGRIFGPSFLQSTVISATHIDHRNPLLRCEDRLSLF